MERKEQINERVPEPPWSPKPSPHTKLIQPKNYKYDSNIELFKDALCLGIVIGAVIMIIIYFIIWNFF